MSIEYQEDLHAELGYRTAGRREIAQREWFSLRGEADEAAPTPKAFDALVNRLRVKKWTAENPDKRAAIARRYYAKPHVTERQLALARKRRFDAWIAAGPTRACAECCVEFCPIAPKRGIERKFCTTNCEARQHQRRRRRANGSRAIRCSVCGDAGHNARRHA